jgi:hypothetical protein
MIFVFILIKKELCNSLPKGIHHEVIRSNFAELENNKYDG